MNFQIPLRRFAGILLGLITAAGPSRADFVLDDFASAGQSFGFTYPTTTTTFAQNLGSNAGLGSIVNRSIAVSLLNVPPTPPSPFQYGVTGTAGGSGGNFPCAHQQHRCHGDHNAELHVLPRESLRFLRESLVAERTFHSLRRPRR